MDESQKREIEEAIVAADDALYHLRSARNYLGSASNWGLWDIFGGGLISGLVKHSKMSDAEREVNAAKYSLQKFSRELQDVSGYSSIHIDDFITFADFFFDGLVADIIVQSKIRDAKIQCDDAIQRVSAIRTELVNKLNS
jgi:hypothetical protein